VAEPVARPGRRALPISRPNRNGEPLECASLHGQSMVFRFWMTVLTVR
jgi:hypothetical protein